MSDAPADLHARIATLEAQVAFLARFVGASLPGGPTGGSTLPPPPGVFAAPQPMDEVAALVHNGNKIGAIKRYRELTGASLGDAKAAVDRIT